jgi:hypothetical protein
MHSHTSVILKQAGIAYILLCISYNFLYFIYFLNNMQIYSRDTTALLYIKYIATFHSAIDS